MKVTEHLNKSKPGKHIISFEILPPVKGKSIESIYKSLDPLMEFKPSFINVTYHRSEQTFRKQNDGSFQRVEIPKRPGTVGICAAVINKYKIDEVYNLAAQSFVKSSFDNPIETANVNALAVLNFLEIKSN